MSEPAREHRGPIAPRPPAARCPGISLAVIGAIAIGLAASGASARESAAAISLPAGSETVAPGQLVTVRWSGLPPGTGECELLLLLDDSATAAVRITEELDPDAGAFVWTVPNLSSGKARLAIRFNRGRGEEAGPVSAAFRIDGRRTASVQAVRYRAGEWWTADGPVSSIGPPCAPRRCRERARAGASFEMVADAEWPRRGTIGDSTAVRHATHLTLRSARPEDGEPDVERQPRSIPMRT